MKKAASKREPDSTYFLKLLLYIVLGTIWVKYNDRPVFPLGLILGLIFVQHDHFRIDRKIEYAVLVVAALLGLIGYGVFLTV